MEIKNFKKTIIIFIIVTTFFLLLLGWFFSIFNSRDLDSSEEVESQVIPIKPLTKEEKKDLLYELSTDELTEEEKTEQIKILEQLTATAPQPVNDDAENNGLDILNSLNSDIDEQKQLDLLESLQN
jgi:hypothetical protein